MKLALRLCAGLILLLILGLVGAVLFIDSLVEKAVEKGGTHALGVPVELESASIGALSGSFALERLRVANPPGFTHPDFFSLRSARLELPLAALRKERVVVPRLELEGIAVDLERNRKGTNYGAILDSLSRFESGGAAPDDEPSGGGKVFVLQQLVIRDVHASVALLPELGEGTKASLSIPEIVVEDLGTDLTLPQICALVTKTVLRTALREGAGVLPEELLHDLDGRMRELEDAARAFAGQELEEARSKIEERLGAAAGKAVQDAGDKLGDLLKKNE